jgi:holo-[acyl-carrier protein] synthase
MRLTKDNLVEVLTTISRKDRAQIQDSTPLDALLAGSLGRAKLDAALRCRYGISDPRIYQSATVSHLCTLLGLESSPSASTDTTALPSQAVSQPQAMRGEMQLGVDLQSVADLPVSADYWEEEFYKSTFRPREIAYALLQTDPRESFTAMWCAKEALRKAVPAFASIEWTRIEVAHDINGKPSLQVDGKPLDGALSLSHTRDYAVAVFNGHDNGRTAAVPIEMAGSGREQSAPQRGKQIGAVSVLSLLLSILALLATATTFFHK